MKNKTLQRQSLKPKQRFLHFTALTVFSTAAFAGSLFSDEIGFTSPDEAVNALVAAVKEDNNEEIIKILGNEAKALLDSGDKVEDNADRSHFLKAYEEGHLLEKSNDKKFILAIGKNGWPFPIPIIKENNNWYFDTKVAAQEILNRRVGRNELFTIQSLLAYVEAQQEYYVTNPERNKLLSYADKVLSSPNKRDGLYYPVEKGEHLSPLGALFAKAQQSGYLKNDKQTGPEAYHGYYYRILKGQGPNAPGGTADYVVKGKMLGGHAMIAWPDEYGNSGIMTFIVNQEGKIYQKDLGPETDKLVPKIMKYDPDKTWKEIEENDKKLSE
jgi:hypothetical protein